MREGEETASGKKKVRRTFNILLHGVEKFSLPRLAPEPLQKLAASVAQSKLFLCGDEARKDSTHLIHICKAQQHGEEGGREGRREARHASS